MSLEATAGSTETSHREPEQDMEGQDTQKKIHGLSSTSPARTELQQPLVQHSSAPTGDRQLSSQQERNLGKQKEEMRAKRVKKTSVMRHLLMCKSLF